MHYRSLVWGHSGGEDYKRIPDDAGNLGAGPDGGDDMTPNSVIEGWILALTICTMGLLILLSLLYFVVMNKDRIVLILILLLGIAVVFVIPLAGCFARGRCG